MVAAIIAVGVLTYLWLSHWISRGGTAVRILKRECLVFVGFFALFAGAYFLANPRQEDGVLMALFIVALLIGWRAIQIARLLGKRKHADLRPQPSHRDGNPQS